MPCMFVPIVAVTKPSQRASTAVMRTRVQASAAADPKALMIRPLSARPSAPGSCRSAAPVTWMTNRPRHSTPATAAVVAISCSSCGELRSSRVASSIWLQSQVVAELAACANWSAIELNELATSSCV